MRNFPKREPEHFVFAWEHYGVAGGEIECWLHGSRFDLRTGDPSGPPAWQAVQTFPTAIEADGAVMVSVA